MEDGAENEDCRAAGPDSDLTTPLLEFVVETGVENLDTDTVGVVQSDKDIQGHDQVYHSTKNTILVLKKPF